MSRIQSQGSWIDYEVQDGKASSPVLLCLPGWCGSRAVFDPFMQQVRNRSVITMDLPGHGRSSMPEADFGAEALVEAALAVIKDSGAQQIIPVALSHAGWAAIELYRRLGPARIPQLVLLDWLVLDPPPPFLGALQGLQQPGQWQATRDALFAMWLQGSQDAGLQQYVREDMGSSAAAMWARAGREIAAAYAADGYPLKALAALKSPPPVLHVYSQPSDPAYLEAQQGFAQAHPWFSVRKIDAISHFPTIEKPSAVVDAIEAFLA